MGKLRTRTVSLDEAANKFLNTKNIKTAKGYRTSLSARILCVASPLFLLLYPRFKGVPIDVVDCPSYFGMIFLKRFSFCYEQTL